MLSRPRGTWGAGGVAQARLKRQLVSRSFCGSNGSLCACEKAFEAFALINPDTDAHTHTLTHTMHVHMCILRLGAHKSMNSPMYSCTVCMQSFFFFFFFFKLRTFAQAQARVTFRRFRGCQLLFPWTCLPNLGGACR